MHKRILLILIAAVLILSAPVTAFAEGSLVWSRTRLSTARGSVRGLFAEYRVEIPRDPAAGHLLVDRVVFANLTPSLEKLEFFVRPVTVGPAPAPVLGLYVFTREAWRDTYNLTVVTRSRDYVFAAHFEEDNPFTDARDRAMFAACRSLLTLANVQRMLVLPASQLNERSMSLFANGNLLARNAVVSRGGVYYLPVRLLSEALGYRVAWDNRTRRVTISRGSFSQSFVMRSSTYQGRGFTAIMIDNQCFASTSFFSRMLNRNIEIDEWGNVYVFNRR